MIPDISEIDTKILHELSQEMDGFGYNELRRRTKLNRKTLTVHLNKLEEYDIISKEKLGNKQNSPTIYKAKLNENIKYAAMDGFISNSGIVGKDHNFYRLNKNAMMSALPYMLLGFTTTYYQSILEYTTGVVSRMELQYISQMMIEYIDDLKDFVSRKFSKNNRKRVLDEGITFQGSELGRTDWMISDSMERKELRTSYEIKLASEIINPDRFIWCEKSIKNKKRSELIKDPKKKKEYLELEEKYLQTLDQLVQLQRKLIGRFEDRKLRKFETSGEYDAGGFRATTFTEIP